MIVGAAAELWGVPRTELLTDRSTVVHPVSGRSATYGELAERSAAQWPPLRPQLKSPAEFRLIGRSMPRRDIPAKVTGQAVFGLDVRLPGMLHAAIARCPTFNGSVLQVNDSTARAIDGVLDVLRVPSGVAVIASHSYAALRGRDALEITWQLPSAPVSSHEISTALAAAVTSDTAQVHRDDGGVLDALRGGGTLSGVYDVPYLAHAPLEPMNCSAHVTPDRCQVWAPTQAPHEALDVAARITGLPAEQITIHTTYLGGGFGRRTVPDFVAETVDLAQRLRLPVQVLWSREDDMRHGFYRPAVTQRIEAALDERGLPCAWRHRVASVRPGGAVEVDWSALMGATPLPYAVGPMRIEWNGVQAPIPTTIWRSVGHSFTTFAIESFLDELAHSLGRDPVAYRLSLLPTSHRLRRCLQEVAEMSGWRQPEDARRALGVAAAECFGSYIALVVEVAAGNDTPVRVLKAWCALDCGIVVNPDGAAAQVEGGILFGLTAALMGRITVDGGKVVEGNFDSYPLLRIDETPEIEIRIIPSGESPGGVGELGVPPVAPAVANALFAAQGTRFRTLPLAR
jgi:isoquinoline 1-oxidoreductase beta subunit